MGGTNTSRSYADKQRRAEENRKENRKAEENRKDDKKRRTEENRKAAPKRKGRTSHRPRSSVQKKVRPRIILCIKGTTSVELDGTYRPANGNENVWRRPTRHGQPLFIYRARNG